MKKYSALIVSVFGVTLMNNFGIDAHTLFVESGWSASLNHLFNLLFLLSMILPNALIYSFLLEDRTSPEVYFITALLSFFGPLLLGVFFAWHANVHLEAADVIISAMTMLVCAIGIADFADEIQGTAVWQSVALIIALFLFTYLDQCFLNFNHGFDVLTMVQTLGFSMLIAGAVGFIGKDRRWI